MPGALPGPLPEFLGAFFWYPVQSSPLPEGACPEESFTSFGEEDERSHGVRFGMATDIHHAPASPRPASRPASGRKRTSQRGRIEADLEEAAKHGRKRVTFSNEQGEQCNRSSLSISIATLSCQVFLLKLFLARSKYCRACGGACGPCGPCGACGAGTRTFWACSGKWLFVFCRVVQMLVQEALCATTSPSIPVGRIGREKAPVASPGSGAKEESAGDERQESFYVQRRRVRHGFPDRTVVVEPSDTSSQGRPSGPRRSGSARGSRLVGGACSFGKVCEGSDSCIREACCSVYDMWGRLPRLGGLGGAHAYPHQRPALCVHVARVHVQVCSKVQPYPTFGGTHPGAEVFVRVLLPAFHAESLLEVPCCCQAYERETFQVHCGRLSICLPYSGCIEYSYGSTRRDSNREAEKAAARLEVVCFSCFSFCF